MGCGFVAIPAITKFCLKYNIYDQPNGRKIHHQPIPRLGGISFVPGMLLASVIVFFLMSTGIQREIQVSLWCSSDNPRFSIHLQRHQPH